ncbi:MAG: glycosyltransferase family 2 protein [Actinomycetota bacterium]|nr:glycosyltransferase family 2 protein [Actinomycetota bacterium]
MVVPTRHRPALLARAVEAILSQRYPGEVECIVVFDRTDIVLPELATRDRRALRGVGNERTPGLAGARNAGAHAATGDLLAFCDDDDEWLPDKLQLQVEALEANPQAAAVASGLEIRQRDRTTVRMPAETLTHRDFLRNRQMEVNAVTVLVPRERFLGEIGPVDESLPGSYAEDYEWALRATRYGPIVSVQRPLVRIYWHGESWFVGQWQTVVDALRYLLERYPEFREEPRGLARVQGQIAFALAASGQRREARRWARRALAASARERRAYLAYAVSFGLLKAEHVLRLARAVGRGI